MLKRTRWRGLPGPARSVHWASALTAATHVVAAGPRAKSAQNVTACESERFDWLRPRGNSIFAADVATARANRIAERERSAGRKYTADTARLAAPSATTSVT